MEIFTRNQDWKSNIKNYGLYMILGIWTKLKKVGYIEVNYYKKSHGIKIEKEISDNVKIIDIFIFNIKISIYINIRS
jgi:hypothetical protein